MKREESWYATKWLMGQLSKCTILVNLPITNIISKVQNVTQIC